MSTIYDDIRIAFSQVIETVSSGVLPDPIPVAWENEEFDPENEAINGEYYSVFFISLDSEAGSLGDIGLDENVGIFQINVYVKKESGSKRLNELADILVDGFPIRQPVSYNGVNCRIRGITRNPAEFDGAYQFASIDIDFEAFTQQRA